MIRTMLLGLVISTSAGPSSAQAPKPPVAQLEAMKKLDFLVGQWAGEGWMEFAPGQRRTFKGTESVQSQLDGLLLLIEGRHLGKMAERGPEVVVHHAFALISFDDASKAYRFDAFTNRGNRENTVAKVGDKTVTWGMKMPQFGDVRYTITLNEQGHWFEIGEVTRDGKEWRKFFEMTMRKDQKP